MKLKPLISRQQIETRVRELGEQITKAAPPGESLLVVSILKGSFIFLADLVREIGVPLEIDFLKVSSYGPSTRPSGDVRFEMDLGIDPAGRHVLLVEDVVDSGQTFERILGLLERRDPASIKTACLLLKEGVNPLMRARVDFVGFEIPSRFVVGYGLDYAERFRERADISVLEGTEN